MSLPCARPSSAISLNTAGSLDSSRKDRLLKAPFAHWGKTILAFAVGLGLALGGQRTASAQSVHYTGPQNVLYSPSTNAPLAVAFDQASNVYLSDGNIVYKGTRSGGTYTFSTVKSGLSNVTGVAVDLNGNVYIADQYVTQVYKETPSAGTYAESLIGTNLSTPAAVAVDANGNIYVADRNNAHIIKETLSGGNYTESTIGSSYSNLYGVAVDTAGNVYVADYNSNAFFKETFSSGTYTQSTIASGFSNPISIAVDARGNVYPLDQSSSSIYKETLSSGTYTQSTIGSGGLAGPQSIAVDGNGNVLVADRFNNRFVEVFAMPPSFGPVPVGSVSATQTETFTFDTGGTGIAAAVFTQGETALDFIDLGTGTCATNGTAHTYAMGDICTVNVRFSPKVAGIRTGAVNLTGSGGAVLASALLQGFGTGPQGVFYPGTQTTVPSSSTLNGPLGMTVDARGNVYIADTYNNRVLKETLSGGTYTESTIGTGISTPIGVAVDGAGNVYVADYGNNRVLRETLSGGTYTQSAIVSGLFGPQGVAVDASGNVYIGDAGNNRVLKETLLQGSYVESTVATSLNGPAGIAVDGDGNVYIASFSGNTVFKETLTSGGYIRSSIGSGLSGPGGVAVDRTGNVYIADYSNNRVLLETLSAGTYTQRTIGSGFSSPYGIAVDGSGNTYVAQYGNSRVANLNVSSPQTLTFPSTNVGASSATQTATLVNIGNAPLTFLVPGTGTNPSLATGFSLSNSSTCPQLSVLSSPGTLAAGATCTDILSFAPISSGTVTGQLVTTDTHLNASPSTTQVVNLSGVAITPPPALTSISPNYGPAAGGTSVTITGTDLTGATDVSFGGTPATSFTVVSSTSIIAIAPAGPAGVSMGLTVTTPAGIGVTTFGNGYTYQTAQTLTFPQPTTPVVNGVAPVTLTATAGSGLAVTYTVVSGPATVTGSLLTYTGAGSVVVRADQAGNATYVAATPISYTILVSAAPTSYTAPYTPVGTVSAIQTATITFNAGATLNATSATAIQAVTQGGIGLDFTYTPGGTCVAGTNYLIGQTCTVRYTFAPRSPGTRYGAINLTDSNGLLVGTAYLQGTGSGPQTAFYPGTQTVAFSTGLAGPFAVAEDGSGNIYIADYTNNRVLKETLSGGSYTESTIGSGLSSPSGVAVDGGGNLYIADTGNNRVLKEMLSGGSYVETVIGSGMNQPSGLAVDGSGNLYIGDYGNNRVLKETLTAGGYTETTIGIGLTHPVGVAVDGDGNVAIADLGNNRVLMETLSGGVYTQTTVGSGTISPGGVAMDGTGALYIADTGTDRLLKETLSGGVYTETVLGIGLLNPTGVAVDGSGNLLIADLNNHRVLKIDVATPSAFSFASTALGATATAQTATLVNVGNTALTLSAVATSSATFPLDSATTTCSTASPLAASATCTLGAKFTPVTTGALTGTFNLTSDTLNAASTLQQLPLTGTGTQLTATVAVANASILYGASTTLSSTVTFVSGYTPTGAFTFTVGSGAALAATCVAATATTETCTAVYPAGTLTVSPYTITGSLAADTSYQTASGTGTLTIAPVPVSITFALANHAYGDAPFAVSASSASDGAFTYSVLSGPAILSSTTLTLTGAGSITVLATQAATANYAANTQQAIFTVAKAPLTATANLATRLYGAANPTLTGTVTGAVYADTFTGTYTTAATATSPVGSYPITPAVSGAALANYTLTANPGTLTVTPAPVTVTVASSSTSAAASQSVTLTATITSTTSGTPTGSVILYDNGMALQTLTLSNGATTYAAVLTPGTVHVITVSYAGDTNFTASLPTANPSTTVTVGSTDYGFTNTTGSSSVTVAAGQPITFTFQVTPPAGSLYPDVVTFSVTGLPPGATATFSPSSLPQNSGPTAVQMTVQTVKTAANTLPVPFGRTTLPLAFAAMLLPMLGLRRRLAKTLPPPLLGLLLVLGGVAAAGTMIGCGTTKPKNSVPQSYVLTVTTTSGTVQHSQTVTLNLQ